MITSIIVCPLFGFYMGLIASSIMGTFGAGALYLVSKYFGQHYVEQKFPFKVKYFRDKVAENKDSMFYFMCFLR